MTHNADYDAGCPRCFIEDKPCARHCDPATCPDPAHSAEKDAPLVVEIDEDPEVEAALLRSLGLDPETATIDDLDRILPPGVSP